MNSLSSGLGMECCSLNFDVMCPLLYKAEARGLKIVQ